MQKVFNYRVFLDPPANFSPQMESAGCYCDCKGKLLLVQRQFNKSQPNTWGVPGGKLEKNEDALTAVIREMKEEVGIALSPDALFKIKALYVQLPPLDYIFHMFYTSLPAFPPIVLDRSENQEARWTTIQEALQLPLIAAGKEALLYYKNFLSGEATKPFSR